MSDFFYITKRTKPRANVVEIIPKFVVSETEDLMIRGKEFYAVWLEKKGLWSTNEYDAVRLIDREIDIYAKEHEAEFTNYTVNKLYMKDSDSGSMDRWRKYCQKQMVQNAFHPLDEEIIFADTPVSKTNFASKKLKYSLIDGDISAYDRLIGTLYAPEERHKLEWAIGSIVSGDSRFIQKFMVLYGSAGSGKSTILNVIEKLFKPYCATFDAKALGNPNSTFALEPFKDNPLVAIQHDGDLSRIEDNARLNSLISHEELTVNEKFKSLYSMRFMSFLFVGTNKPVRITDAKSGLLRRLIDVTPSGNTLPKREYDKVVKQIDFELGAIAKHCLDIYMEDPMYYDDYVPTNMIDATNTFYNFVADSYFTLMATDPIQLSAVWTMYKEYCDDAKLPYPMSRPAFKQELKNYYEEYSERAMVDGKYVRNVFSGFKHYIFDAEFPGKDDEEVTYDGDWIELRECEDISANILNRFLCDSPAQYATKSGTPKRAWSNCETTLSDLDARRLHYVQGPDNLIVIDFDLKDSDGNKCFELNLEAANRWPKTYVETSKSGGGLHLHYIYDGDVEELSSSYDKDIEIKVYTGNSALRRCLTKCNDLEISHISGGLPIKKKKGEKMLDVSVIKSERALRSLIVRNLRKEIHPGTKPSIDFIRKILDEAYESGLCYNVEDMKDDIFAFAAHSTNNAKWCMEQVNKMKFVGKTEPTTLPDPEDGKLVFFDIEIFPNLFVICFKVQGEEEVMSLINPSAEEVKGLMKLPLVGFNNRDYDNHMIWYASQGYSTAMLFDVSQSIINTGRGKNAAAYGLSYADVYEFAKKKQSLKKWEVELGIHHDELGLPWDQPVDPSLWKRVAEYCKNDVKATEAVFNHLAGDFIVKKTLAKMAGGVVNDSTSQLTYKILFGNEKHPQDKFNYRDMGDESDIVEYLFDDEWATFNSKGQPVFKGYTFKKGVSTYRDDIAGEGGYVYAEPGLYFNVALLDIASMHPHSVLAEELFGIYTKRFEDLVHGRITIKHIVKAIKDGEAEERINELLDDAKRNLFDGDLAEFLDDREALFALPDAFKLVINKVYGLTKAKFDNPLRDPRNVDNIVAKRGALFMINLKHAVQDRGYTVAHIKTDSIKIPDADDDIINFVMEYGKAYGYTFEHEATYERMCLVNDAVYIARYADTMEWTATGTEFKRPYVFKTLFSDEGIHANDFSLVISSKYPLYLDMDQDLTDGEHDYRFVGKVGEFCPVVEQGHGGILLAKSTDEAGEDHYSAPSGTKGYRFLERGIIDKSESHDLIDIGYFDSLVADAKEHIIKFIPTGDFDAFVHGIRDDCEELPFK